MSGAVRAVLKYPGSKWRLADWIVSLMPPHKSYLEPFFGSGAVFFKKPPSRIETINDLDGEIVNLFRCIRERSEKLARAVALTPYSREEYELAWRHRRTPSTVDNVERARLTLVRYWQTHGSSYCQYEGLLAPSYETSCRDGCWMCHNQGVNQLRLLRRDYPELWAVLLKWDTDSPVNFHPDGRTVHDFDRRFQLEDEGLLSPDDKVFRWKMLDEELQYRIKGM